MSGHLHRRRWLTTLASWASILGLLVAVGVQAGGCAEPSRTVLLQALPEGTSLAELRVRFPDGRAVPVDPDGTFPVRAADHGAWVLITRGELLLAEKRLDLGRDRHPVLEVSSP